MDLGERPRAKHAMRNHRRHQRHGAEAADRRSGPRTEGERPFPGCPDEVIARVLIASMRAAACHGLHGLQERCARWILMTLDRVDSDRFAVTKEFLAQLLGTNRPTASVLISTFEKAGILHVDGRWVTLADRNRLTGAACECYDIIRKNYEAVGG